MRFLLLALLPIAACAQPGPQPAAAPYTDAMAQAAVQSLLPQPFLGVPLSASSAGQAGSGNTFVPSNASAPSLTRSGTGTTASDGTFTMTWAVPLVSAIPPVNVIPINAGNQPVVCNVTARSASTVSGKCWVLQTTALTLAVVTSGVVVNPTLASGGGIPVMVVAREPSQ